MARLFYARTIAAFAVAFSGAVTPARADAIDGNWCHTENGRLSINGARIVTPGGTNMRGNYDRHAFTYIVPPAEPGAGSTVSMILVNDETLHLTHPIQPAGSPPQIWRRCPADIS